MSRSLTHSYLRTHACLLLTLTHSGNIDHSEFKLLMNDLKWVMTDDEMKQAINYLDKVHTHARTHTRALFSGCMNVSLKGAKGDADMTEQGLEASQTIPLTCRKKRKQCVVFSSCPPEPTSWSPS